MTTRTNDADVFEVARLTPIGRGAVACVGIRGKNGWTAFLERWRRADGRETSGEFENWTPNAGKRPFFGLFRLNDRDDAATEEIVLRRRTATAFELNGHGGDVVSSAIIRYFVERGATEIDANRWERAVESEEMNRDDSPLETLFFAAADALATETATETTAKIALGQRAAWKKWFAELASVLRNAAAFSTSNSKSEPRAKSDSLATRLTEKIDRTAQKIELGRRLTEPFVVLLTGVPNAGKSSLLNAILGFRRVVVSSESGTTRDLIDAPKIIDGWKFRFVDAAGLRDAFDPIERAGTRLVVDAAERANVVLRLFDATLGKAEQNDVFERFLGEKTTSSDAIILDVLNKTDLPRECWNADWQKEERGLFLPISAKNECGIDALTAAIFNATVGAATQTPGDPLPWDVAQLRFLSELRGFVERGDFETALKWVERTEK